MSNEIENRWTKTAIAQLLNRKIVNVRYMTEAERDDLGWNRRPIILQLDDGNVVFPSMDDEGNGAGALFTNDAKEPTIPVI